MKSIFSSTSIAAAATATLFACGAHAAQTLGKPVDVCASPQIAKRVQSYLAGNPAAALHVVARELRIPEVHVASSAGASQTAATASVSQDVLKKIWKTIDAWGKNTRVRVVYTMGGRHLLDFPGLVPIAQKDLEDGWIDMYGDDGKGVHGHLWLGTVQSVHAVDFQRAGLQSDSSLHTRTVSLYGADGKLIVGVYASIAGQEFDQAAVEGFAKTRDYLASLPQACR